MILNWWQKHEQTWEVGVEFSTDMEEEQRRERWVLFGLRSRRRRIGEDGHVDVVEEVRWGRRKWRLELEGKGKGGKGRVCDERGENERDITVITVTVN